MCSDWLNFKYVNLFILEFTRNYEILEFGMTILSNHCLHDSACVCLIWVQRQGSHHSWPYFISIGPQQSTIAGGKHFPHCPCESPLAFQRTVWFLYRRYIYYTEPVVFWYPSTNFHCFLGESVLSTALTFWFRSWIPGLFFRVINQHGLVWRNSFWDQHNQSGSWGIGT